MSSFSNIELKKYFKTFVGCRQKIDEAPTPYRYLSESDHSENECESDHSYSSDNAKKAKHKARFICPEERKEHYISPPQKASNSVIDSWETINAKLNYEKHLQGILVSPMFLTGIYDM